MPKTITQLPAAASAESSAVVAADNASGTLTEKVTLGQIAALASGGSVSSVNGATGTIVLTSASVSAASAVHSHVPADITGFADAVTSANIVRSLNGITGVVVLTHTSVSAAAASHTHAAGDVTSGTFDIARIPTIGYTALSGVPTTFAPATHTHTIAAVDGLQAALDGKASLAATNVSRVETLNGLTGTLTITAGSNVTVSTSGSSITITAASGGGGTVSRSILWLLR